MYAVKRDGKKVAVNIGQLACTKHTHTHAHAHGHAHTRAHAHAHAHIHTRTHTRTHAHTHTHVLTNLEHLRHVGHVVLPSVGIGCLQLQDVVVAALLGRALLLPQGNRQL